MGDGRGKVDSKTRENYVQLIGEAVNSGASLHKACETICISVRTFKRWCVFKEDQRNGPKSTPHNALSEETRQAVLSIATSEKYADLTPRQIVPRLADEGVYIASESSFYRILKSKNLLHHRGRAAAPQNHSKPKELTAVGPNQIWSWDITYLKTQQKGVFFFLYLILDIFSRKIVHAEIHSAQSDELAAKMIKNAYLKNNIRPGQITLHSDNGAPMKGVFMLSMLEYLGIDASFSRPGVSDDNPYSEAAFKTFKYYPTYPK